MCHQRIYDKPDPRQTLEGILYRLRVGLSLAGFASIRSLFYRPADDSVMHSEEIRYRLHRVVASGVGGNHRGFRVTMFLLVIVQWLCQGAALRARYHANIGFISQSLHALDKRL